MGVVGNGNGGSGCDRAVVLWSLRDMIPPNALEIRSIPTTEGGGGVLVLCVNEILRVDARGRVAAALGLNGWVGGTCSPLHVVPNCASLWNRGRTTQNSPRRESSHVCRLGSFLRHEERYGSGGTDGIVYGSSALMSSTSRRNVGSVATSASSLSPTWMPPTILRPNPYPLPLGSIQLDGSAMTFVSPDVALLCLRDGRLYSLEIHPEGRIQRHHPHSSTRHCLSLASLGRVVGENIHTYDTEWVFIDCTVGPERAAPRELL